MEHLNAGDLAPITEAAGQEINELIGSRTDMRTAEQCSFWSQDARPPPPAAPGMIRNVKKLHASYRVS